MTQNNSTTYFSFHNKTNNDGQYVIIPEQKVKAVRFVNQGNCVIWINNLLKIPVGGDFEFKGDEFSDIDLKVSIKFDVSLSIESKNLPDFVENEPNLIIILVHKKDGGNG